MPTNRQQQTAAPRGARRVIAEARYLRLMAEDGWEWAERTNTRGAVVVVALTAERELVLVEQYRIPMGARVIELPAGLAGDAPAGPQEELGEAARRELLEETGFAAGPMQYLLEGPSTAGMANEVYALFLARDVRRVAPGGGDAGEDIQVHLVPLDQADAWLEARRREGVMVDPRVYAGLYFAAK